MTDTKISSLADGAAPQDTDLFVVARSNSNNSLTWAELKAAIPAGGDTLHTVASSGSSLTVDYSTADVWDITLTANCTFTLTGFTSSQPDFLTLIIRQDGTGSRTVTWPAITWIGSGIEPTLQTAASSVDSVVLFSVDGGSTVYGIAQTSASGLRTGSSFPGSPSDGDLFYRTDRRVLYEYDSGSSNWLSTVRHYAPANSILGASATGTQSFWAISETLYVESFIVHSFVTTTNGTNFWTVTLSKVTAANVATTVSSFTTAGDTAANFVRHDVSVGAIFDPSTYPVFSIALTKTLSPTSFNAGVGFIVRSVG